MLPIIHLVAGVAAAMLIHELGHLTAAFKCGVPASELALGIGPKLCGLRFGRVQFNLRLLPVSSFVRLDGTALAQRALAQRLFVHLGGVLANLLVGLATYHTSFGQINFLLAATNMLPFYQHDGWKCGVALVRTLLRRQSRTVEIAFTFSGGFLSLALVYLLIRHLL